GVIKNWDARRKLSPTRSPSSDRMITSHRSRRSVLGAMIHTLDEREAGHLSIVLLLDADIEALRLQGFERLLTGDLFLGRSGNLAIHQLDLVCNGLSGCIDVDGVDASFLQAIGQLAKGL